MKVVINSVLRLFGGHIHRTKAKRRNQNSMKLNVTVSALEQRLLLSSDTPLLLTPPSPTTTESSLTTLSTTPESADGGTTTTTSGTTSGSGSTMPGSGSSLPGGGGLPSGGGGTMPTNSPPVLNVTLIPFRDSAVNGDVVGIASAIDPDGDAVAFSFDGGSLTDPSGTFAIDGGTGVITVINDSNIGSQDGDHDCLIGWTFVATIVASDGSASPADSATTVTFNAEKTAYKITAPTEGQNFASKDKIVFKGERAKGVNVKAEIEIKKADGTWGPTPAGTGVKVFPGAGGKTTVEHDFGRGVTGEYRLRYFFKKAGNWEQAPDGEVMFSIDAPVP